MTPAPDLHLDDSAAQWALRLSTGPLTSAEESMFATWLKSDAGNQSRLESFCAVYAGLAHTVPAMVRRGQLSDPVAAPARPSFALFKRLFVPTAFAAALILAAVIHLRRPQPYTTQIAQRQSIVLADGSHVDLNARTSLDVRLRSDRRLIHLENGEAYFAVAKDQTRPFFIETTAGTVRVTGTAFNVRSTSPDQLEVTVLEGSVQVTPTTGALQQLTPGDQLSITGSQLVTQKLSVALARDAIAWRDGLMIFESESLSTAVERFARYHGRDIQVSPAVAALEIGGRFKLDELDRFLEGIAVSLPVKIYRTDSGPIRIGPR